MTQKPPPLPEPFLDAFLGAIERETSSIFDVGDTFLGGWERYGEAYTEWFGSERKAHAYFVYETARNTGYKRSSLRHRYRVSKHVTQQIRNKPGSEIFNYSQWRAMLAGDGDPDENLEKNLEWAHEQWEAHGAPPMPEKIRDYAEGTLDIPVWANRLERLVGILQAMADDDGAPNWLRDLCHAALKEIAKRSE